MPQPSVDSDSPPTQDTRLVIASWHTEGYEIKLMDAGADGADITYRDSHGLKTVGDIRFDPDLNRHIIEWNDTGWMVLERYKRDHFDSKFYYTMAKWRRRQPQEPDELESWRRDQEQQFQDRLRKLDHDDV